MQAPVSQSQNKQTKYCIPVLCMATHLPYTYISGHEKQRTGLYSDAWGRVIPSSRRLSAYRMMINRQDRFSLSGGKSATYCFFFINYDGIPLHIPRETAFLTVITQKLGNMISLVKSNDRYSGFYRYRPSMITNDSSVFNGSIHRPLSVSVA